MDVVDVGGLEIAFERRGSGPPLVLVHGYVGDRRTWRAQLDGLSDAFDVIAWDAPGFGGSSDPSEDISLSDYADYLAGFVAALELKRPAVAGLSFGGGLALELYRRHPDLPAALILGSAYAGWAGSLPPEEVDKRVQQALRLSELSSDELLATLMPTMFGPSAPTSLVAEFAASVAEFHPAGLRATARCFGAADLREMLPSVKVPTLLICGEQDVRAPLHVANQLHEGIPGSTLIRLPGVGHIVNIESPERFNAEVRDFLLRAQR